MEALGLVSRGVRPFLETVERACDTIPQAFLRRLFMQGCATALARGNYEVLLQGRNVVARYSEERAEALAASQSLSESGVSATTSAGSLPWPGRGRVAEERAEAFPASQSLPELGVSATTSASSLSEPGRGSAADL